MLVDLAHAPLQMPIRRDPEFFNRLRSKEIMTEAKVSTLQDNPFYTVLLLSKALLSVLTVNRAESFETSRDFLWSRSSNC